jgi:hypothetical protein
MADASELTPTAIHPGASKAALSRVSPLDAEPSMLVSLATSRSHRGAFKKNLFAVVVIPCRSVGSVDSVATFEQLFQRHVTASDAAHSGPNLPPRQPDSQQQPASVYISAQ